jgi:RNA polymerase sigma-70 factor (ECF subfamily)
MRRPGGLRTAAGQDGRLAKRPVVGCFVAIIMASTSLSSGQFALRDPDVRLMLRVRADESGAFAELVARYQHRLLAVMSHLCGNMEEAEDLAQEVFLRVYRARKEYHPQAKFSTWLFTIANNLALNVFRRRQRKPMVHLEVRDSGPLGPRPAENLVYDRAPAPEHQLDCQELAAVVQKALTQLNERQRLAVVLNKFEDLSYQEIAEVLRISPKAVKSLLSRARTQLRDLLKDYVHGDDYEKLKVES